MMMLASSNQDFNVYINMLFTGAHKLFVTRLLQSEDLEQQSLALKYETSLNQDDHDFEAEIE
jgi:hypothetical protein